MNAYLSKMLDTNSFLQNNKWESLTSAISKNEAIFLMDILQKVNPQNTLEIGCAEGVSSMVICSQIKTPNKHLIIDPNQTRYWNNKGKGNLELAGLTNFFIWEEFSEFALPQLLKEGRSFDFIFVDGWHTFDHVLLEFFYINRLLNIDGVVVFDDCGMPGINRVMRYILNYENFKFFGQSDPEKPTYKRMVLNGMRTILNTVSAPLGNRLKSEIFSDTVLRSDQKYNLNSSMLAFQKTAEDKRGWGWYQSF